MVVRLVGTNEAQGRALLEQSEYEMLTAATLAEAAQKAVAAAKSGLAALRPGLVEG
jgi:succinyl-CoA synthetase beta subunit